MQTPAQIRIIDGQAFPLAMELPRNEPTLRNLDGFAYI